MYVNESLKKYIDELGSRQSTPGGGSASALTGATGTALLEMVSNFTIGNDKYKDFKKDIKKYLVSLKKIREGFLSLIDDDVKAYSEIRAVFKSKDKKNIDRALKTGYHICFEICELSKNALEIASILPEKSNVNLLTDVGCGAELLNAAFNSGIFNCEVNLKGIEDGCFTEKEIAILDTLKEKVQVLYREAIQKTKERMR